MNTLTDRQLREKNYYSQFALNFDTNNIDFSPVEGPLKESERRPWNSYWRTYEIPVDHIKNHSTSLSNAQLKLLDFGCGPGDNALRFSHVGYHVTGFDICDENINNCKKIFEQNNCQDRAEFIVSTAEDLKFSDACFDVVVGIDILHHVDIPKALKEVDRVLKENGVAIFREPIEVPLLDTLRNSWPMKQLFPNKPSLEAHITEDERKLNSADLKLIKDYFPETTIERSLVISRLDKFFRKHGDKSPSVLEKWDHFLMKLFPIWGNLGGAAVIIIKKRILM